MEVIIDRCAGLDVHKNQITACVRRWGEGRRGLARLVRFSRSSRHCVNCRAWLVGEQVTHVAMEATGVYWKPISGVAVGAQGAARGVAAASTRSACESGIVVTVFC